MNNMQLIIERIDKNNIIVTSTPLRMGILSFLLDELDLINTFKDEIERDIDNLAVPGFTFNSTGLKVKDKNTLIVYDLYSEDEEPEKMGFEAPRTALWDLLDEYSKIVNTDWKKITISFDGKKFDLKTEY